MATLACMAALVGPTPSEFFAGKEPVASMVDDHTNGALSRHLSAQQGQDPQSSAFLSCFRSVLLGCWDSSHREERRPASHLADLSNSTMTNGEATLSSSQDAGILLRPTKGAAVSRLGELSASSNPRSNQPTSLSVVSCEGSTISHLGVIADNYWDIWFSGFGRAVVRSAIVFFRIGSDAYLQAP
jgi:hypothetical protein